VRQKRVREKQTDIARRTNYVSELISEDRARKMPRARGRRRPSCSSLSSHVAARGPPAPRGNAPGRRRCLRLAGPRTGTPLALGSAFAETKSGDGRCPVYGFIPVLCVMCMVMCLPLPGRGLLLLGAMITMLIAGNRQRGKKLPHKRGTPASAPISRYALRPSQRGGGGAYRGGGGHAGGTCATRGGSGSG